MIPSNPDSQKPGEHSQPSATNVDKCIEFLVVNGDATDETLRDSERLITEPLMTGVDWAEVGLSTAVDVELMAVVGAGQVDPSDFTKRNTEFYVLRLRSDDQIVGAIVEKGVARAIIENPTKGPAETAWALTDQAVTCIEAGPGVTRIKKFGRGRASGGGLRHGAKEFGDDVTVGRTQFLIGMGEDGRIEISDHDSLNGTAITYATSNGEPARI